MQESSEQLIQRLSFLMKQQQAGAKDHFPHWALGIGVVLLAIGILTYGSYWGLLWMPGALMFGGGLMANADATRKSRRNIQEIEKIEAVLTDRKRSAS